MTSLRQMMLVPAGHITDHPDAYRQREAAPQLDRSMSDILNATRMSEDEKAKKYLATLHSYLKINAALVEQAAKARHRTPGRRSNTHSTTTTNRWHACQEAEMDHSILARDACQETQPLALSRKQLNVNGYQKPVGNGYGIDALPRGYAKLWVCP